MIAQKAPSLDECLWVMSTMLHDQMSGKVPVKEIAHTVHIGSVCMCMSHVCAGTRAVPVVLAGRFLSFKYGGFGSEREI